MQHTLTGETWGAVCVDEETETGSRDRVREATRKVLYIRDMVTGRGETALENGNFLFPPRIEYTWSRGSLEKTTSLEIINFALNSFAMVSRWTRLQRLLTGPVFFSGKRLEIFPRHDIN